MYTQDLVKYLLKHYKKLYDKDTENSYIFINDVNVGFY